MICKRHEVSAMYPPVIDIQNLKFGDDRGGSKMDRAAGRRAKLFRMAAGYSSGRKFALEHGIVYGTWNNIENGASMGTAVWLKVARRWPGMTHDWFKYGDGRGLSGSMSQLINGLPIEPRSKRDNIP